MLLKIPLNLFHEDKHLNGHSDNVHLLFQHGKPEVAMREPKCTEISTSDRRVLEISPAEKFTHPHLNWPGLVGF